MLYGVPIVMENPQVVYGGFPNTPVPLFTMSAVDDYYIGANEFDTLTPLSDPSELRSNIHSWRGPGFAGLGYDVMTPNQPVLNVQETPPIQRSTMVGAAVIAAVILLGSAALWFYKKM